MNENALTHLLFTTLEKVGSTIRARFLSDVVGLAGELDGPPTVRTQAGWEDAGQKRAIVVGIAPLPGLDHGVDRRGGSIVDAAIFTNGIAVLFEMKVTGMLRRAQLVRHARHWALDLDDTGVSDAELALEDGFALRTWDHVRGWLGRELADDEKSQLDGRRLAELATAIEQRGLGTPDRAQDAATRAITLPVDHPRPVPVREMVAGIDLDALARSCVALYGKRGSHRVDKHACRQDAQRITAEYEQAQQPGPRDMTGDPMTPPRVLTVLYSNEGLRDAAPKAWTDLRARLLNRGADRAVLLALLAWASQNEGSTASKRLYAAVARIWSQAERRLPALDELHAAVDEARQSPRAA